MSAIPTWLGATAGQAPQSGQVNQLLGAHTTQYLYAGTLKANSTVDGGAHTNSNSQWMAQSFATSAGQTTIGYVVIPLTSFTASGGTLGPTTLSLYANSGGAPTGAALVTTTVTTEYAFAVSGGTFATDVFYPLPITGLTASTTYWLVTTPVGGSTPHYGWQRSTAVSGASTSANGTTWAAQAYGFRYQIFDQVSTGTNVLMTWEDSGARWTQSTFNATTGLLTTYAEYTVAQGSSQYVQGYRTMTYSNGSLTKVV